MGARIVEGTFTAVMLYLIVANSGGFSAAARAAGEVYTSAVKALQGRD